MELIYCFENASFTQRVLLYLQRTWQSPLDTVTTIFLNDRWVLRLKLDDASDEDYRKDCIAVLDENGAPFLPSITMILALKDLDEGFSPVQTMEHHHVVVVSHGFPHLQEIEYFREQFVEGLGYCPHSLV